MGEEDRQSLEVVRLLAFSTSSVVCMNMADLSCPPLMAVMQDILLFS